MPVTFSLQDQVVLVKGSSRGLGVAIAKTFAKEGSKVILNYHKSQEMAEQLALQIGVSRTAQM